MALVNQKTGERQGIANYVLYPLAAKTGSSCTSNAAMASTANSSSCIFYDVVTGNNSVACVGGSPNCSNTTSGGYGILEVKPPSNPLPAWTTGAGYDLATGLGSVNAANLVNKWTSITFAPTTTALSLSTAPVTNPITLTHGQPVNFTVTVAPNSASGTPTGDVSLIAQTGSSSSNVTGIGPFTLSSASVSNSTDMLPGGTYGVTAHYAGNGTYGASDSTPAVPVTVSPEGSRTRVALLTFSPTTGQEISSNATSVVYGSSFEILRADVTNSSGQLCYSSSYPCPAGQVTLTDSAPALTLGIYNLNSQGYTEDQFIQLAGGTNNVVASYSGDSSYNASTSPTDTITITPAPTTVTISGLPSSVLGSHVVFYANISTQSNGAAPTGSVQLLNNGVAVGSPVSITAGNPGTSGAYANAQASFVVNLPIGMSSITVQYGGDGNYAGSTSAAVAVSNADFSLSANPTAISLSAPGNPGSSTLTITTGGLPATTIGLSCVTQYVGTNCTISPGGFNTSGSGVLTATITITTTGQAAAISSSRSATVPPSFRSPVAWPWLLAGLLGLATLASLATAGRSGTTLLFGVTLLVAGAWAACGGGGGPSPLPAPSVNLAPSALTFYSPSVGATSSAQTVTLWNTGNAALSISSITLGGVNAGDFGQTNNCGASVASGANCAINVTFTPTATGSRSASLTIADNASGSPQSVSLSGSVTAMPVASLSPASLSFGPENDGAATAPQTLTLANTGSALLSISSIAIQGPNFFDFVQSNNCGASVAAGANCAISVQFKPTSYGYASTASLAVADNAPGSPQTSSLTGTALPPVTPPGNFWADVMAEGEATGAQGYQEWFHQIQLTVTVQ
jgi:hypothetical protein